MKFAYSFFLLLTVLLLSCGSDTTTQNTPSNIELKLVFSSKIHNQILDANKFYLLTGGDSIMMTRLDFYLQNPIISTSNEEQKETDTVFLYNLTGIRANEWTIKIDNLYPTLKTIGFLNGLNDLTNENNPNLFPKDHPLSSWNNMYWTDWTKYRYIIFEGKIKKSTGDLISFSYHSGLSFRRNIALDDSRQLDPNQVNTINIQLQIDKIFNPSSGSNINYDGGESETQAHGGAGEAEITNKFIDNFKAAFSIN